MELDLRKQRILQAIVHDYVATAEPVGSQVLVERYSLGVKSATIRSEMAEMSERGYLRQPHTSAGRVPSDQGYRFYVNRLMPLPIIPPDESDAIRRVVESASSELDAILQQTCRILAEMTRLPAVATPPDADDTELRQIFVTPVGTVKTLLVLLFSTGRTENRLLPLAVTAAQALLLANALNERWVGMPLSRLRTGTTHGGTSVPPRELAPLASLWNRICDDIFAAARTVGSDAPVFVEGTNTVLSYPEFRDVDRLSQFLATLQERAALLELLDSALKIADRQGTVRVAIGEEMGRPDLVGFAVVKAPYFIAGRESGMLGVLGPTRMDYARASAAVGLMANTVGDLLTRLSIA